MATMGSNLEFNQDLLKEVVHQDCLVIMSKGLGLEKLLMQLIQTYIEPGLILFILGTNVDLENYIKRQLSFNGVAENRIPKIINADVPSHERIKLYNSGGTFFISSRILVTDMLSERVPFDIVSGMIVYNVHKIMQAYQDLFCLRLYRANNRKGFIMGLSQLAPNFLKGYACLDRIMRSIFATKLFLWPRSRKEIVKSLETRAMPELIEMRFTMSQLMESIQFSIIDLIGMCLKQMKETNAALLADAEELDIENAISTAFGKYLEKRFEPVWHQLTAGTKRLINDISTLRRMLFALTDMDCISFYHLVESIKKSVKLDTNISDWFFWKPSSTLFDATIARVTRGNEIGDNDDEDEDGLNLETNLKWSSFSETVAELRQSSKANKEEINLLVLVRDDFTVSRLINVLDLGPRNLLKELYFKTKETLKTVAGKTSSQSQPVNKANAASSGKKESESQEGPSNVNIDATSPDANRKRIRMQDIADKSSLSLSNVLNDYEAFAELTDCANFHVVYHSYTDGYIKLEEKLATYNPKHVIMYDADLEAIRRLELYQALSVAPESIKIYFFIYDASAEEQRYLSSLRKEKDAFDLLAKEKATMIIPEERDGKSGDHPDLIRSNALVMSTKSVDRNKVISQKVIVDMREFRSELPCLLHKRGIDIVPVTIEIGDYVLCNDTCVERKSISDLIGSLNSGRLYTQTSVMCRHYKRSILLIEFEESQYFNLKGKISFNFKRFSGSVAETTDSLRKLILLTITFPSLRIIWSASPHFSAEMFEFLKQDQEQPDLEYVLNISSEQLPAEHFSEKFDLELREFLLSLPGVNYHNVYKIMSSCACLVDLMKKSLDEVTAIVDSPRNGKALYDALHRSLTDSCLNREVESRAAFQNRYQGKNIRGKSNTGPTKRMRK